LNEAIKKAELKEFLNNQPNGIDSIISDKGLNLSGGQKQRLAIARSIYHNKEIIVLDEFTSALDANTVSKIMELLLKLKKEKTIILSSHDSNVLNVCDKIIKLT
jgi:ABC-type bacteriocin/lantibiotic exporter with double-glycine peptidase domain